MTSNDDIVPFDAVSSDTSPTQAKSKPIINLAKLRAEWAKTSSSNTTAKEHLLSDEETETPTPIPALKEETPPAQTTIATEPPPIATTTTRVTIAPDPEIPSDIPLPSHPRTQDIYREPSFFDYGFLGVFTLLHLILGIASFASKSDFGGVLFVNILLFFLMSFWYAWNTSAYLTWNINELFTHLKNSECYNPFVVRMISGLKFILFGLCISSLLPFCVSWVIGVKFRLPNALFPYSNFYSSRFISSIFGLVCIMLFFSLIYGIVQILSVYMSVGAMYRCTAGTCALTWSCPEIVSLSVLFGFSIMTSLTSAATCLVRNLNSSVFGLYLLQIVWAAPVGIIAGCNLGMVLVETQKLQMIVSGCAFWGKVVFGCSLFMVLESFCSLFMIALYPRVTIRMTVIGIGTGLNCLLNIGALIDVWQKWKLHRVKRDMFDNAVAGIY